MAYSVGDLISKYDEEFFAPELRQSRVPGDLNIIGGGVTEFLAMQVCIPILTGLLSSWLYDRWKIIRVKSEAIDAIEDINSFLSGARQGSTSQVERPAIEEHVRGVLTENGFTKQEALGLSSSLVAKIESDLPRLEGMPPNTSPRADG